MHEAHLGLNRHEKVDVARGGPRVAGIGLVVLAPGVERAGGGTDISGGCAPDGGTRSVAPESPVIDVAVVEVVRENDELDVAEDAEAVVREVLVAVVVDDSHRDADLIARLQAVQRGRERSEVDRDGLLVGNRGNRLGLVDEGLVDINQVDLHVIEAEVTVVVKPRRAVPVLVETNGPTYLDIREARKIGQIDFRGVPLTLLPAGSVEAATGSVVGPCLLVIDVVRRVVPRINQAVGACDIATAGELVFLDVGPGGAAIGRGLQDSSLVPVVEEVRVLELEGHTDCGRGVNRGGRKVAQHRIERAKHLIETAVRKVVVANLVVRVVDVVLTEGVQTADVHVGIGHGNRTHVGVPATAVLRHHGGPGAARSGYLLQSAIEAGVVVP